MAPRIGPTESTLTKRMAVHIRKQGHWCRKTHGGPQGAGWPDLVGVAFGAFLGLEVKRPGREKDLTKLQQVTLDGINAAGGLGRMVVSIADVDAVLYEAQTRMRILSRIKVTKAGCWEWQGATGKGGYGKISFNNQPVGVHRVMAALYLGHPVGSGFDICHTCDNPPCCYPGHLWVGTRGENLQDMAAKGRNNGQLPLALAAEIGAAYGTDTVSSLARRFEVSRRTVRRLGEKHQEGR